MTPSSGKTDWKSHARSFDRVAETYDRCRPSYPPELVEALIERTGLPAGGRILEVGSGTGKATILFARRGYAIHCLEPGANLAAVAARNLEDFPRVSFEETTFEDWPVQAGAYDLLVSAQAFHWTAEETRFSKAAAALKEGGALALFWNYYPPTQGEIYRELDEIYRRFFPDQPGGGVPLDEYIRYWQDQIRCTPFFSGLDTWQHPWSETASTAEYIGLLNTYSDHLTLPEPVQKELFQTVGELIDRHGGRIEKPYMATLFTARKV